MINIKKIDVVIIRKALETYQLSLKFSINILESKTVATTTSDDVFVLSNMTESLKQVIKLLAEFDQY